MAIPGTQLGIARDLLLIHPANTALDAVITGEWEQQLALLSRRYDLFTVATNITSAVGQSVYSVPTNTTRIISVFHRGRALGYTDQTTLALRDPNWETALPGTPRYWSYNAIPGEVDLPTAVEISPREFVISPAPDGAQSGAGTLLVLSQAIPSSVPAWLEPILLYLTVGSIAAQNTSLTQPEKGEFFNNLAELWLNTARRRQQI